ncbi:MAG: ABC-type transport auxiliary lipoprotein family protein [Planctomycetota bacterium]
MKLSSYLLIVLCAVGCTSPLQTAYPEKSYFVIDARRKGEPVSAPSAPVLRIGHVRISSQYSGRELTYKTDEQQYESDFYNEFLDDPARLIEEQAFSWLSSSGRFEQVLDPGHPSRAAWRLDLRIQTLYGDYHDAEPPEAVLAMQTFLLDEDSGTQSVLLFDSYEARVPCEGDAPSLAAAWSEALREILQELEEDLAAFAETN